MKSVWMMSEAELQTLPLWEEGTKLAGKPVYLSIENWNEVWRLFTADLATKTINGLTLQKIIGCSPIANQDFGKFAVIIINSAVEINAKTMEFFMFHELGHIVRAHGTKRCNEAGQVAGILSSLQFEIEADQFAFEHTGYSINFKKEFSQIIPWNFEKLRELFEISTDQDELVAMTMVNPELTARQDNIDVLVKASVAS